MSESIEEVHARLKAKLDERKAAGTYVSWEDQQAAWVAKVRATLDPIGEALERGVRESEQRAARASVRVCPQCEDSINEAGECLCVATGRKMKR